MWRTITVILKQIVYAALFTLAMVRLLYLTRRNQAPIYKLSKEGEIVAGVFKDETLYMLDDDLYLVQAEGDIYIMADRLIVDHTNIEKWLEEHKNYGIPDNIIELVVTDIHSQGGKFDDSYHIEIFVPTKFNNVSGSKGGIDPNDDPGQGDTSVSSYTYNGYTLKTVVVKRGRTNTVTNYMGSNWVSIASGIVSVLLSCVGMASMNVGYLSASYTMYDFLIGAFGSHAGTSVDRVETAIGYWHYYKCAYIYEPSGWSSSPWSASNHVHTNSRNVTEYRSSVGEVYCEGSQTMAKDYYSPNYRFPSSAAINNYINNIPQVYVADSDIIYWVGYDYAILN